MSRSSRIANGLLPILRITAPYFRVYILLRYSQQLVKLHRDIDFDCGGLAEISCAPCAPSIIPYSSDSSNTILRIRVDALCIAPAGSLVACSICVREGVRNARRKCKQAFASVVCVPRKWCHRAADGRRGEFLGMTRLLLFAREIRCWPT